MRNHWGESVGFSFRAALWCPQWFCLCEVSETNVIMSFDLLAVFTVKCNHSVSFPFLFLCFLFFFDKDQIASFQLREIVVVLNYKVFRVYIYFIAWLRPSLNYNRFRVLHAVDSLDVKRELRSKRHFRTIFLGLPLENRVLLFAWIKVKGEWHHWAALRAGWFRHYWGSNNDSK